MKFFPKAKSKSRGKEQSGITSADDQSKHRFKVQQCCSTEERG